MDNKITIELKQIESASNAVKNQDIKLLTKTLKENPQIAVANPFLLEKACGIGNLEIVKELFIDGYLDDDEYGFACQKAVLKNHPEIVRFFLSKGVPTYFDNYSLLKYASKLEDVTILKILGEYNADFWAGNYFVLEDSIRVGNLEMLKYLLIDAGCPYEKAVLFSKQNPLILEKFDAYQLALQEKEMLINDVGQLNVKYNNKML